MCAKLSEKKNWPWWLKKRFSQAEQIAEISGYLSQARLETICQSANCPNIFECLRNKSLTFSILGSRCTRRCAFCNVYNGKPVSLDDHLPDRLVRALKHLSLELVVLTSVSRDDLSDGGAGFFALCVAKIKAHCPQAKVEILVPDFQGSTGAIRLVLSSQPDVFAHNLDTVKRLQRKIKPQSEYRRSLRILETAKEVNAKIYTKSSLMLGLGEAEAEVVQALKDLRSVGCDFVSIGQYLRPSRKNVTVQRFVSPEEFAQYQKISLKLGFKFAFCAPFARSSNAFFEYFKMYQINPLAACLPCQPAG
jgi:lipoic acid synthetase